jgi:hypothetical protein
LGPSASELAAFERPHRLAQNTRKVPGFW